MDSFKTKNQRKYFIEEFSSKTGISPKEIHASLQVGATGSNTLVLDMLLSNLLVNNVYNLSKESYWYYYKKEGFFCPTRNPQSWKYYTPDKFPEIIIPVWQYEGDNELPTWYNLHILIQ